MIRACGYLPPDSDALVELRTYIDRCQFDPDADPFSVSSVKFDLYILDAESDCDDQRDKIIHRLPGIVSRCSNVVFLVWSKSTWDRLSQLYPHVAVNPNLINGSASRWVQDLMLSLRSMKRKKDEVKRKKK